MQSTRPTPTSTSTTRLLGLSAALLTLIVLNLIVFDDVRVDPSAGVVETLTKPAHLSSIIPVVVAIVLLRMRHRIAVGYTVVVAWIEIAAFVFFHGIPWQFGPTEPFWGQGMGDLLQWTGLLAILGCCAAIIVTARRPAVTLTHAG